MNIGFIGAGNMGTALIKGIVKSGLIPPQQIYIFDIEYEKLKGLSKETGVNILKNNADLVIKSDIIILAVKPNVIKTVLESCKEAFNKSKLLISIAVGVPISAYKDIIGEEVKIVRTMPNMPALVEEGMTLAAYDKNVDNGDKKVVKDIFGCVGKVEDLDEKYMNEVTALTGSSPAYVYMFIEAMSDAAVQLGIPRSLSYRLAAQAVLGSAKMVLETGKHPAELKDQVCSPAGTTIEAVAALEKNGFRHAVIDAMNECTRRAREISQNMK